MPNCSKCGKPVSGSICPNCQTPIPSSSIAKQADVDFDIYEGFTAEEVTIFNQYLRLVQSGWLEVAAVDRLSTDHDKSLDEIKSIIKRGLKALQKAQERALKEAELKAKQLAKDEKKNARQAAKLAKKNVKKSTENSPTTTPSGGSRALWFIKKYQLWLWPLLLLILVTKIIFMFSGEEEPPPALPAAPAALKENYFLRQGRVACYQQDDMENIIRSATNRKIFEEMLSSGRCFINNNYLQIKDISAVSGSIRKGYAAGLGWLFFHHEGLEKQTQP